MIVYAILVKPAWFILTGLNMKHDGKAHFRN